MEEVVDGLDATLVGICRSTILHTRAVNNDNPAGITPWKLESTSMPGSIDTSRPGSSTRES